MRINKAYVIAILSALPFVMLWGCEVRPPAWPEKILSNLYVPRGAKKIHYYILDGSYQVSFVKKEEFPGEKFIGDVVRYMEGHGWKRLEEDFLNPGSKSYWKRKGSIESQWGTYLHGDQDVAQWIEDWEDSEKNIVRYGMKYSHPASTEFGFTGKDKSISVVAIYIPKELRPDPKVLARQIKELRKKLNVKDDKERRRWIQENGP